MAEPTDWWYYFKKTAQGNVASCMHCNWTKDRSKDKSTKGLKYHLEHSHPAQFSQKLEAERIKEKEKFEKNKTQQKLDFVKKPRIVLGLGSDEVSRDRW
jgi:hypothetical protein